MANQNVVLELPSRCGRVARSCSLVAGEKAVYMDTQHKCEEGGEAVKSPSKKPYAEPVLLVLGSFSDLTLTIGPSGKSDGGSQRGRRSTRF